MSHADQEYGKLTALPQPQTLDDRQHHHKWRYINIRPTVAHRVQMPNIVVNADHFKNMILTQAPIPTTFGDFWRMAHHYDSTIVMLTQFVEHGRRKADQYWPYNDEHVSVVEVEAKVGTHFSTRVFLVTVDGVEKRLTHFHFTSWGDHDVPKVDHIQDLLYALLRYFGNPLIIHCSAGVGRSGTLAAIIECQVSKRTPYQVVKELRQCRAGAVQTKEQYAFISNVYGAYRPPT
jgi:protein tyrosine phosphatase